MVVRRMEILRRKAGTKGAGFFGGGENWKKIELAHPETLLDRCSFGGANARF